MKTTFRKKSCAYCVVAPNMKELARMFVRLQEFYESPFPQIRGKHFTLKKFKSIYSKDKDGVFTYYDDWAGFNVPGHIVIEFFQRFKDLSPRERQLKKWLGEAFQSSDKFYLIGYPRRSADSIMEHEFAHALFYTNPEYRKQMLQCGRQLPRNIRRIVFSKLKSMGYNADVQYDELQAYLATSKMSHLKYWFGEKITAKHSRPFKKLFKQYFE